MERCTCHPVVVPPCHAAIPHDILILRDPAEPLDLPAEHEPGAVLVLGSLCISASLRRGRQSILRPLPRSVGHETPLEASGAL
jgi:hypothetical protein